MNIKKGSLRIKRESCYFKIQTYKKRREALRNKYPPVSFSPGPTYPPEYHEAVKRINLKIKLWSRQIKRIDMRTNQIIALGNAVAIYTGKNVKQSNHSKLEGMKLAKSLFYKYGLENKIPAKELREYVGANRINQPTDYRREFTLSFRTKPENKQQWLNFCDYMRNLPIASEAVSHVIPNKKQ
jgi:hypothetical protein